MSLGRKTVSFERKTSMNTETDISSLDGTPWVDGKRSYGSLSSAERNPILQMGGKTIPDEA